MSVVLATLEWRRPRRRHRWARVAAATLAPVALGSMAYPPTFEIVSRETAVLLLNSPGSTRDALRHTADSLGASLITFWPDSIDRLSLVPQRFPNLSKMVITGWGLSQEDWEDDSGIAIEFRPDPLPENPRIALPSQIEIGRQLLVYGKIERAKDSITIVVSATGEAPDTIRTDSLGRFTLRLAPKTAGRLRYQITLPNSASADYYLEAISPSAPTIAILEGSPNFETRFLRRWLETQGASIGIRTKLGPEQYRYEAVNFPEQLLKQPDSTTWRQVQLAIVDGASLTSLTDRQRKDLQRAIVEDGLGLLVLYDSLAIQDDEFFPFRVAGTDGDAEQRARPQWSGHTGTSLSLIPSHGEFLTYDGLVPLVHDPQGRTLVGAKPRGAGWIAGTLVESPSQWQLDNEPESYAGYWAYLFEKLARRDRESWRLISDGAPLSGYPVALTLVSRGEPEHPILSLPDGSRDSLTLVQDLIDSERWWTRFWPPLPGWYQVTNGESEPYSFYVTDSVVDPIRAASRTAATSRFIAMEAAATADSEQRQILMPLPRILPFLLLILALGYLWAEDRNLISSIYR